MGGCRGWWPVAAKGARHSHTHNRGEITMWAFWAILGPPAVVLVAYGGGENVRGDVGIGVVLVVG